MGRKSTSVALQFAPRDDAGAETGVPEPEVSLAVVTELRGVVHRALSGCRLCARLLVNFALGALCERARLVGITPTDHAPLVLPGARYPTSTCGYRGPGPDDDPALPLVLYVDQTYTTSAPGCTLEIDWPADNLYPYFQWPTAVIDFDPPLRETELDPRTFGAQLLDLLGRHNAARAGLAPALNWNADLAKAARAHANWLLSTYPEICAGRATPAASWDPDAGVGEAATPAARALAAGYPEGAVVGEAVVLRAASSEAAMTALLAGAEAPALDARWLVMGAALVPHNLLGHSTALWCVVYGDRLVADKAAMLDPWALTLDGLLSLSPPATEDDQERGVQMPMRLVAVGQDAGTETVLQPLIYEDAPGFTGSGDNVTTRLRPAWSLTAKQIVDTLDRVIGRYDVYWRIWKGSGDMLYHAECDGSTIPVQYRDRRNAGIGGGSGLIQTTNLLAARISLELSIDTGLMRWYAFSPSYPLRVFTGTRRERFPLPPSWDGQSFPATAPAWQSTYPAVQYPDYASDFNVDFAWWPSMWSGLARLAVQALHAVQRDPRDLFGTTPLPNQQGLWMQGKRLWAITISSAGITAAEIGLPAGDTPAILFARDTLDHLDEMTDLDYRTHRLAHALAQMVRLGPEESIADAAVVAPIQAEGFAVAYGWHWARGALRAALVPFREECMPEFIEITCIGQFVTSLWEVTGALEQTPVEDESITLTPGDWVGLAHRVVSSVALRVGDDPLTQGTDFEVDAEAGRVRALPDGQITEPTAALATYSYEALTAAVANLYPPTRSRPRTGIVSIYRPSYGANYQWNYQGVVPGWGANPQPACCYPAIGDTVQPMAAWYDVDDVLQKFWHVQYQDRVETSDSRDLSARCSPSFSWEGRSGEQGYRQGGFVVSPDPPSPEDLRDPYEIYTDSSYSVEVALGSVIAEDVDSPVTSDANYISACQAFCSGGAEIDFYNTHSPYGGTPPTVGAVRMRAWGGVQTELYRLRSVVSSPRLWSLVFAADDCEAIYVLARGYGTQRSAQLEYQWSGSTYPSGLPVHGGQVELVYYNNDQTQIIRTSTLTDLVRPPTPETYVNGSWYGAVMNTASAGAATEVEPASSDMMPPSYVLHTPHGPIALPEDGYWPTMFPEGVMDGAFIDGHPVRAQMSFLGDGAWSQAENEVARRGGYAADPGLEAFFIGGA